MAKLPSELIEKYRNASKRLILLDYDGTLVGYASLPYKARLPEHVFNILIKLIRTPKTEVIIITGRSSDDIDKMLGRLPVNIIAEHGAMIKENGIWKGLINDNTLWKEALIPLLNQITLACPKSFVEEKSFSIAWHYRNSDCQSGFYYSRELLSVLEQVIHLYNLKILNGNKVIEIITNESGKGEAARKLFEKNNYDFILSIGDDTTDEEMFEYFLHNPDAFTVKVGIGNSIGKYRLASTSDVTLLLKHLAA